MIENFKHFSPITFETPLWFDFGGGMVIQVKAVELQDIIVPSKGMIEKYNIRLHDNGMSYCIWSSRKSEQVPTYNVTVNGEHTGWPPREHIQPTPEELDECEWNNQLIWIDEPIGHEVQMGSDVFLTLEQCLQFSRVSERRYRNRAHKKLNAWRKQQMNWIGKTHTDNGGSFPDFPKYEYKKIYIKR